ncbi:4-alpha-glucanotransferase [Desnuesiella massiliensis]|uniref:4-alpha-glucanotransferase n=1 Tax=Desnuesiella massiliensis TaxID=1650662 RepID=UPI0006E19684|nr:4-alpha-glucanotransferase [Desnuesiella massiliensis]
MNRSSGIIMHIASLPGNYGIGTFGKEAYNFADFLKKSGQKFWQILPLGHTGFADSPYQCFSAFAGNPYFIDLDLLVEDKLLKCSDLENIKFCNNEEKIDYTLLSKEKMRILKKAYQNSKNKLESDIYKFSEENEIWLENYCLYMAIKEQFSFVSWQKWDNEIKNRERDALEYYKHLLKDEIEYWRFIQYEFFKQWKNLKKYVNSLGIEIIGDIPIYVAEDSSDLWANQEIFLLDENKVPLKVAGCPPDAFSETGQLWGNPIYNWHEIENSDFKWWKDRIRFSLSLYDVIRIDHFRGFESFWEIPYGDKTAEKGRWVKGPGMKLIKAIKEELDDVKIIAEDLGYITEEVIKLREESGFPGMKVLQFAFDSDSNNVYLPHNYTENCVAYTGTHDNDTIRGWFEITGNKESIVYCKKYLGLNKDEGYNWGFIRGTWSSVANLSICLMQDFLNLGNNSRINLPSTLGWWTWRLKKDYLTDELANKIYEMTKTYGRCCSNE